MILFSLSWRGAEGGEDRGDRKDRNGNNCAQQLTTYTWAAAICRKMWHHKSYKKLMCTLFFIIFITETCALAHLLPLPSFAFFLKKGTIYLSSNNTLLISSQSLMFFGPLKKPSNLVTPSAKKYHSQSWKLSKKIKSCIWLWVFTKSGACNQSWINPLWVDA